MSVSLEVRGSFHDTLHPIVREGLAGLHAALAEVGRTLPRHVARGFEGFLGCGDPANGFAWLWCDRCDHHRIVPFSCKGRGFCPSCGGRRMAERAAAWVDRVLPHVATRQWVLTVPWGRRWLLARNPKLARGVHAVAMKRIERWYAETAGRNDGKTGSISIQQRFGSSLGLNVHYHVIFLDGVYVRPADGRLSFRQVTAHTADVVSRRTQGAGHLVNPRSRPSRDALRRVGWERSAPPTETRPPSVSAAADLPHSRTPPARSSGRFAPGRSGIVATASVLRIYGLPVR